MKVKNENHHCGNCQHCKFKAAENKMPITSHFWCDIFEIPVEKDKCPCQGEYWQKENQ